jgi:hypothetical protein
MLPESLGGPAASGGGAPPAGGAASSAGGGAAPPRQLRQRQRAKRGQATDPHSIAERVCMPPFHFSSLQAELFPLLTKNNNIL